MVIREVPEGEYTIPIVDVKREGTDVTIVSFANNKGSFKSC